MNLSREEFSSLLKSKTPKIKVYQDNHGSWRVCWFGFRGAYYVSMGTGKGHEAWQKAVDMAFQTKSKDPLQMAFLYNKLMYLEKSNNVPTTS